MSIRGKRSSTRRRPLGKPIRLRWDMASPHSDTMTLQRSLMNSGAPEAVRMDRRMKIGSMPRSNCGLALTPAELPIHFYLAQRGHSHVAATTATEALTFHY